MTQKITEQTSRYNHLEAMSVRELLENINKAESRGVELSARFRVSQQLSLGNSFTYMKTEDESTGEELLRRPKVKTAVSLDYRFSEALSAFLETVFVGGRADNDYNVYPAERIRLAGYTLLNLNISYSLSPRVELYARGENLLDQEYEEVYGYGMRGSAGYGGVRVKL